MGKRLINCALSILGDSYSTFEGQVPAGNYLYYPNEGIPDVRSPEDTWWHQLISRRRMKLLINDSSSGTTVSTSVRPEHRVGDAFVKRMVKSLSAAGVDGRKPDCILLFGGTNDDWLDVPMGELMYAGWQEQDLRCFLPAYCYMLSETVINNPQAAVFAIINTDMKEETTAGIRAACAHYGVPAVELRGISKKNGHPDRLGMRQIAEQVGQALDEYTADHE